jgi:hypothetical protein
MHKFSLLPAPYTQAHRVGVISGDHWGGEGSNSWDLFRGALARVEHRFEIPHLVLVDACGHACGLPDGGVGVLLYKNKKNLQNFKPAQKNSLGECQVISLI